MLTSTLFRPETIAIKRFNTLKTRLTLLFGGLVVAATAIGTWLVSDLAIDELRKSTGQNLQEVAVQLRDKIEIDLYERYSDLTVAATIAKQSLSGEQSASVTAVLNAVQSNFPSYAWIGLVKPDGIVTSSTGGLLQGMDVSARPWFREAAKGPFLGDAHGALLLESKLDNSSSTPLRFVDIAVPLKTEDGELQGILGAHLYLDWVASMGRSFLAPLQERLEAELLVADRSGTILVGPESSVGRNISDSITKASQASQSGYLTEAPVNVDEYATEADQDYLVGFSRLRDRKEYASFNWLVMVRKPAAEAFGPANNLRVTMMTTGVLIALLLIAVASFAARWTSRPLLMMAEEARNLDPDQPSTLIKQRNDYEEVRTLSSTLRNLILRLTEKTRQMNELNATLEARVEARTAELEQAARTDALTGLNNRRYFFELGQKSLKKAVRSGTPVSAIMFDVDFFKKVNDNHGHGVGDKALVHLSQLATNAVRDIDVLARLGGEEFAVLLENTDEQGAAEVATRLRNAIENSPLLLERGSLSLTVSAGVASVHPESSDQLDNLLLIADRALYAAKADGRNRVCLYSELP